MESTDQVILLTFEEDRAPLTIGKPTASQVASDDGDGCFVRSAGRIDAEGMCLQTEPIACMSEGDCGDQSIVQVMSPEGATYVSFQDCAPLGWTVLRDEGSVEHPDAFQWPECNEMRTSESVVWR